VLAIPAVPIEKNEVVDSGLVGGLFDAIEFHHRRSLSAHLDGIHRPNADLSRPLRFLLPPTVEVPPYSWQCKLLRFRHLRAVASAHIRVYKISPLAA